MSERFKSALRSAWKRIEEDQWILGNLGRKNSDGSYTFVVPGRPTHVYVTIRQGNGAQTVVSARNDADVPYYVNQPVRMKLEQGTYVIYGKSKRPDQANVPASPPTGLPAHNHDDLYYRESEFIDTSTGAPDAGKPVLTGAAGTLDPSLVDISTHIAALTSDDIAEGIVNLYISDAELIKLAGIETAADVTDQANVGAAIHSSTEKATLHDNDELAGINSEASNVLTWWKWSTIKTALTALFDTLYAPISHLHSIYAVLAGTAGGQSLSGGTAANEDLTLQGTTHATRTSSYVLLQPNGGNVAVGTTAPDALIHGRHDQSNATSMMLSNASVGAFASAAILVGESVLRSGNLYGGIQYNNASWSPSAGNEAFAASGMTLYARVGASGGVSIAAAHASGAIKLYAGGVATANLIATIAAAGVGIGVTSPQGKLHVHDGVSGFLKVTKTAIIGAAQTIIPDGAGDVTKALTGSYVLSESGGGVVANFLTMIPGDTLDIVVGGYTLRLTLSAGGALTAIRQAGATSGTLTLNISWQ